VYDSVKYHKGTLVLLSRGAQMRKYFGTRRSQINRLKVPLGGTWVFARLPMGGNG
jgi:hypothetical protein